MTTSWASSCTCKLLVLLLPLLFCVHHSSCATLHKPASTTPRPCISSFSQLNIDIDHLGRTVDTCSMNCSSLNITDTVCQCFNLSESQSVQDCRPRDFLLSGLNALRLRLSNKFNVPLLITRLRHFSVDCKGKEAFCHLTVPSKGLISPKNFQKTMRSLVEEYKAALRAQ